MRGGAERGLSGVANLCYTDSRGRDRDRIMGKEREGIKHGEDNLVQTVLTDEIL